MCGLAGRVQKVPGNLYRVREAEERPKVGVERGVGGRRGTLSVDPAPDEFRNPEQMSKPPRGRL